MTRKPVVAGMFYTANAQELKEQIAGFMDSRFRGNDKLINALGVVSPHAGYAYSGVVAGAVLAAIKPKDTYIVLGTNHTGYGKPFGLDAKRNWQTPLGEVRVDKELAKAILDGSDYIEEDHACHDSEHSIEVQLPFLQVLNQFRAGIVPIRDRSDPGSERSRLGIGFVPITILHADKTTYEKIGKELAKAVKKDVTVIASSDMTHYEPEEEAKRKDMAAIEKILALDTGGFLETVAKYNISMCGAAPTAVMMEYAIARGAKSAKLIKYKTGVVGYAGIVVY